MSFVRFSDTRDMTTSGSQMIMPIEFRVFLCAAHGFWRVELNGQVIPHIELPAPN